MPKRFSTFGFIVFRYIATKWTTTIPFLCIDFLIMAFSFGQYRELYAPFTKKCCTSCKYMRDCVIVVQVVIMNAGNNSWQFRIISISPSGNILKTVLPPKLIIHFLRWLCNNRVSFVWNASKNEPWLCARAWERVYLSSKIYFSIIYKPVKIIMFE